MENFSNRIAWLALAIILVAANVNAQRQMENLGRGIVAVRTGASSIFVSWRLLALDPAGIGFNIYRSTAGGAATKLNGAVLTAGTNFTDNGADLTKANAYFVKPVISGAEQAASGSYTVKANTPAEPCIVVPIRKPDADHYTKFVWVGDLDGDGEFDFVIDRLAYADPSDSHLGVANQSVEAYTRSGQFLWSIDMGPSSRDLYNIAPGPSTISMGMWDGVTVYDLDGDGKAEVILKVANGVKFADGTVFTSSDSNKEYIAVVNGQTGAMRANIAVPTDYYALHGKYGIMLGIATLNGKTPSIVAWLRNRNADKSFNDIITAWSFDGTKLTTNWKYLIPGGTANLAGDHQMVFADVDGDGKDEINPGNYLLNSDGTLRYALPGVIHGDRHYITKMDPNRRGLQGYGIQQDNPSGLAEFYYDANTGEMLWKHMFSTADVARGLIGHLNPNYKGWEAWSWWGIYYAPTNTQLTEDPNKPYPCHTIWWDGDLLTENLNDSKVEKFDYVSQNTGRIFLMSNYETSTISNHNPMFMGDLLGDWRTEIISCSSDFSKLIIFTTDIPTDTRLYTMAHNPAHRNAWTLKGYYESALVDYYLGTGMSTPPTPNIKYVGGTTPTTIANGTYHINAKHSGKVIDVAGASMASGAGLIQDTSTDAPSEQWQVTNLGGGNVKIINVNSGLSFDVAGRSVDPAALIQQYPYGGRTNQQFTLVDAGAGYFNIKPVNSGLCIDIASASKADSAAVQQWTCNGGNNQMFSFTSSSGARQASSETSIQLKEVHAKFSLSPNPVVDGNSLNIRFALTAKSGASLVIYDLVGTQVFQKNLGVFEAGNVSHSVELPSFSKGTYIVKVVTIDGALTSKLIAL